MSKLLDIVNQQAEDEGLWFEAATAPEAYLQQELRKLHAVIEMLYESPRDGEQCPDCGDNNFADPKTPFFVPVNGGTSSSPGEPTIHWVEGWIVCRKCGHTEGYSDSD